MEYGTLISVVMPVFNRAHLVPRIVGSLCAQSYRNLDIVIVDDCSSDDIEGAVAALGDPRVRLVRRAVNGGVAAARNTGVAAAKADWIAFHDSDDICVPDRIEQTARALAALPEDYIGVYGARLIYLELPPERYGQMESYLIPRPGAAPLSGDISGPTMRGNIINFPTLLVKKAALEAAGPSDELLRKNVDWDLCLRLTRQGKIGFVPEPLILTPTPTDRATSQARVSRSARQGARSYARITGKLRRAGLTGAPMAAHYRTTAGYLLSMDRIGFAQRFLRAALAEEPFSPRTWVNYVLSGTPQLRRGARKLLHGFR